jgi:integrase/recombinase XerD
METATKNQLILEKLEQDSHLLTSVESFLIDRKAQGLSPDTIKFYRERIGLFTSFCETQLITQTTQITPDVIRRFILSLEGDHNAGGIHACFRSLRAFLYWWENEIEPEGWINPIKKIKAPRVGIEPLEPVSMENVILLLGTCEKGYFIGGRDRAIILTLLDTGARAREFLNIQLDDLEITNGSILIRRGKGHKPRIVFIGTKTRKAIRNYLKARRDNSKFLWITRNGERLSYTGLRELFRRRAKKAGVKQPSIHSFRRAFALQMLRNGVDVFSLQRLMGHADLQILRRYLLQTEGDLREAHLTGSPVDKLF